MSDSPGPHPDPHDLVNFARQQLGSKKTQRILDHCKQCPPCADRLLEAVRDQEIDAPRPPLSRGNWISIGLLVVALVAMIAAMVWFVRSAGQTGPLEAVPPGFEESAPPR